MNIARFRHAHWSFVDASAYFALIHERDERHHEAVAVFGELTAQRYQFFTTNFILAELHALLVARVNRQIALANLLRIDRSRITTVVRVSENDEHRARGILEQYDDREFSLTDATSFAVMERLGINQALAFDQHFVQFGWHVIRTDR